MIDDRLITWLRGYAAAAECRDLPPDELWLRVRDAGDEVAFRVVVEQLGPRVYQICYGVLNDRHLAEDAFQEVFVLLARRRAAIPTFGHARAWVRTAAGLTARHVRRNRRYRTGRERPLVEVPVEAAGPEPDEAGRVTAALVELPDRYRRPLELVYWDGLTHAEAAAELGWSKGKVDSYVARGLEKLRAKLGATAAVSLTATLAAPAPAVSPATLARLAGPLPAVTAGWAVGKLAAVGLLVMGTGVAGAGAWWGLSAPPPAPVAAVIPPAVPESVTQRTDRIYREQVLPVQLAELRKLVLGGGEAILKSVEAYDSRVECWFDLNHLLDGNPWFTSRVRLVHQTATGTTRVFLAVMTPGPMKPINPARPLILWTGDPVSRKEVIGESPSVIGVVKAFDVLPRDREAAAADAAERGRLGRAATPYLGDWYRYGDPSRRNQFEWIADGPQAGVMISRNRQGDGMDAPIEVIRVDPAGNLSGLAGTAFDGLTLTANGGRLSVSNGTWWTRRAEPTSTPNEAGR